MSVVALIVQPDNYVLMAGDGAASDPITGELVGFVSKVTALPDLNAVIGVTGIGGFSHLMRWFMPPHVTSFDELLGVFPDLMKHTFQFIKSHDMAYGGMHKSCVVIAGWSDARQKYEGWRVVTYHKESVINGSGEKRVLEPFVAHPVAEGGMWASTGPGRETLERFGVIDGPEGETDVDQIIRMIGAARSDSGVTAEEGGRFNAGGFAELALVQRGCAQTWIAHRWPEDVIGQPVDPQRGDPLPAHLMGGYRAPA